MDRVIDQIREAFADLDFPGDVFLQGSFEGTEPFDVIAPFKGLRDWKVVDDAVLDANPEALSFFSEAGFRFFLPAYLIADVKDKLQAADPLFHLTYGFYDSSVRLETTKGVLNKRFGRHSLLNPRRYGAIMSYDYARFRLSVFTREEARAIVAYLRYKRQWDTDGIHGKEIDAALESFWLDRAENAPERRMLTQHNREEEEFMRNIDGSLHG